MLTSGQGHIRHHRRLTHNRLLDRICNLHRFGRRTTRLCEPATSGPGSTTYIKLSGTATAPISGIESSDNAAFYVGTSGDNLVHIITRSTLTDSSTLAPGLVDPSGNAVPVDMLAQKPRKTT